MANRKRRSLLPSVLLAGAIKDISINRLLFFFIPQGKKDLPAIMSTFDIAGLIGVLVSSGCYAAGDR